MRISSTVTLMILVTLLQVGCDTPERDWTRTKAANTIAAYRKFVDAHPKSNHAANARARYRALQDEFNWASAQWTNTGGGFKNYLQSEPDGRHVREAQAQMLEYERTRAWRLALRSLSVDSLQGYLRAYPYAPNADEARRQLDALTFVQLAEARSKRSGEKKRD